MFTVDFLNRLDGVSQTGDRTHEARCPSHDDVNPSLTVTETPERNTLIFRHAGCTADAVVAAMGLTLADLYAKSNGRATSHGKAKRTVVARYDYRNAAGAVVFRVGRTEPKAFFQQRPDWAGWVNSMAGAERVLYNLPAVRAATGKDWVYVTEGEKDCDALIALDLIATTNVGGAGKWLPEYAESLAGKRVCILPHNDDKGRMHRDAVRGGTHRVASLVVVVELPGLGDEGDVSDWLDALRECAKADAELKELADAAPAWQPTAEPEPELLHEPEPEPASTSDEIRVVAPAWSEGTATTRVMKMFGPNLHWTKADGWLHFNGKRWVTDATFAIDRCVQKAPRNFLTEAARFPKDDESRGLFHQLIGFAKSNESTAKRNAIRDSVMIEPGVAIESDAMDAGPRSFNVNNGTLELRTGTLREHRRGDLITKISPVKYDASATAPR